jgi:hypothetical protein
MYEIKVEKYTKIFTRAIETGTASSNFQQNTAVWREQVTSKTSMLPIGMQTPVASTETRGGRSTWLWEMPFLTAMAVQPFQHW